MTQPFEIPSILSKTSLLNESNNDNNDSNNSNPQGLRDNSALKSLNMNPFDLENQAIESTTDSIQNVSITDAVDLGDYNNTVESFKLNPANLSFAHSSIFGRSRSKKVVSKTDTVTKTLGPFSFDEVESNETIDQINEIGGLDQNIENGHDSNLAKDSVQQGSDIRPFDATTNKEDSSLNSITGLSLFDRMKMRKNKNISNGTKPPTMDIDVEKVSTKNLQSESPASSFSNVIPSPSSLNVSTNTDSTSSANTANLPSSLSFSASMFSRSVQPKTPTAVTSNGKTITLIRKQPKRNKYLERNEPIPATMDHESIQVPSNGLNEAAPLNKFDNRNQFGIPVYLFKAQFELEYHRKKTEARMAQEEQEKISLLAENDVQMPTFIQNKNTLYSEKLHDTELLTEKYRPKTWLDLVGPEKTHRRLLKWLLQWSPVVYGDSMEIGNAEKSSKYSGYNSLEIRDILGRPQKKMLLIHGPPGIGKTTVAHVIAAHAKYDVIEINASDERSASTVKDRIRTATSSHSLMGSGKPSCIVADEVEGAAEGGFVRALIDLLDRDERAISSIERLVGRENADKMSPRAILKKIKNDRNRHRTETMASELSSGTISINRNKNGKKQNSSQKILENLLMRPIIAVCNDVYAHSLRALRPYSEVVSYNRTSPHTLVNTLQNICKQEKLDVDAKDLTQMAIDSECDLRSCLNTLQFGWQKGKENAPTVDNISKTDTKPLQKKDMSKSWSSVVMRVFQQLRNLRNSSLNSTGAVSMAQIAANGIKTKHDEFSAVLQDIYACGEHDRIVTGIFLAFPHMQYHEDMFRKNIAFGDWLFFHERIDRIIYGGDQQMAIGQYYGYTALAAHSMFNHTGNNKGFPASTGNNRKNIHVSLSEHELYEHRRNSRDLVNSIHKTLSINSPEIYKIFNKHELVTIMIPYLVVLVNPKIPSGFSAISSRSFSKSTKSSTNSTNPTKSEADIKIQHTVDIVLDFGLEYVLGRTEAMTDGKSVGVGSQAYILEPPIEKLALFDEKKQKEASVGTFDVRQKVNLELLKRPKTMLEPFQKVTATIQNKRTNRGLNKRAPEDTHNEKSAKKLKKKKENSNNEEENGDEDEEMTDISKNRSKSGGLLNFAVIRKPSQLNCEHQLNDNIDEFVADSKVKKEFAGGTDPETRIWVQYHEGLSNAVRRNLTWERIWI